MKQPPGCWPKNQWREQIAWQLFSFTNFILLSAEAAEAAAQVTITPPDGEPKVPPRGQRYNPFNKMNEAENKTVQASRHRKYIYFGH